jgi:hypothetical protein
LVQYRSSTAPSKAAFSEYMQKIEPIPDPKRNDLLDGMKVNIRNDDSYSDQDTRTAFD